MAVDFKDFQKLKWYYQVAIVAGVSGGLLFLAWYQYPSLSQMQADVVSKQAAFDDLQKNLVKILQQQKALAQLKKESLALQAKLDGLKSILPLEKETAQILRSMPEVAMSAGLSVPSRISFRPPSDREVYTEHPVDMEVVGTYHNIGSFLDKIRMLPRIVNVSGLKVQSRASQGDAAFRASVSATFTATTFVYKEEQQPASAGPAAPPKK